MSEAPPPNPVLGPSLGAESVDNLARMLLALLSEHWILRDRFAALETLMIKRGTLGPHELDDYVPSPAVAAALEALRDRTVAAVMGAPLAATDRTVAAILARAGLSK